MGIAYLMMQFLFRVLRDYKMHFSQEAQNRQSRLVLVLTLMVALSTYVALGFGTS